DGKGEQQKLPELPKPQGGGSGGGGGGQPQSQQDPCATQGQGVASARGECMQQQDKSLSGIWNSFMPQSDTLTQNLESRESSSIDALARIAGESSEGDVSTTQSSAQAYDSGEFDVQGLRNTSDSLLNDPTPSADQPQRASAESTEIGSQSTGFKESSASMSNDVSLLGGIADRLRGALRWIGSLF
ncbi:MAG: hypothetical protein KJZ78_08785, partial [Bryobacteraceae bacterium]|nr:hypothetical protein [Bryobacteraceae bacterium]